MSNSTYWRDKQPGEQKRMSDVAAYNDADPRNALLKAAQPLYDSDGFSILGNKPRSTPAVPMQDYPEDRDFPDTIPMHYDRIDRVPAKALRDDHATLPRKALRWALIGVCLPFIAIAAAVAYFSL